MLRQAPGIIINLYQYVVDDHFISASSVSSIENKVALPSISHVGRDGASTVEDVLQLRVYDVILKSEIT